MGSKKKSKAPESNINQAQLDAMAQQQRLADEARAREQAMIQQQTTEQSTQFNSMLSVYQAQAQQLQESKVAQDKYMADLEAQQQAQLKSVQDAANREEVIAQQKQKQNVQQTSRAYGVLSERRTKNTGNRASVFGNSALPTGYNINKGIM